MGRSVKEKVSESTLVQVSLGPVSQGGRPHQITPSRLVIQGVKGMVSMSPSSFTRSLLPALSVRQPPGLDRVTCPVLFYLAGHQPREPDRADRPGLHRCFHTCRWPCSGVGSAWPGPTLPGIGWRHRSHRRQLQHVPTKHQSRRARRQVRLCLSAPPYPFSAIRDII